MNGVSRDLERIIEKLDDKEFAAALDKWKYKIVKCVFSVHRIRGEEAADILSEVLCDLVAMNAAYKETMYRYKGRLYEISKEDGALVRVVPSRQTVTKSNPFWIPRNRLSLVIKTSLSAMVYRRIHQYKCNALNGHFTAKNGFVVGEFEEGQVVSGNGERPEIKTIQKKIPKRAVETCYIEDFVDEEGEPTLQLEGTALPHDFIVTCEDLVSKVNEILSEPARVVLQALTVDPDTSDRQITKKYAVPLQRVRASRVEIAKKAERLTQVFEESGNFVPVYFGCDA